MDELHNDSTTVSFYGAYDDAAEGQKRGKRTRLAITFGYSKDHRPDLKQQLDILTVSDDGSLPLYPEHRACRAPTARRIVDIFQTVQRHRLTAGDESSTFVTQLSPLQSQVANWFGIRPDQYGR